MEEVAPLTVPPPTVPTTLGGALIFCESCGKPTLHRVLRVSKRGSTRIHGLARCNHCRWTHAFSASPPSESQIRQILSRGSRSEPSTVSRPSAERLEVGHRLSNAVPPVRILRIDTHAGRQVSSARVDSIATIWVAPDDEVSVPVSIVEGRRTRPARLLLSPPTRLTVGDEIQVAGDRLLIASLRARRRTWRRVGDVFEAREVERIYGRRTSRPPAGNKAWSRDRGIPRSRAKAISRSSRSRSRPGVSKNSTFPRALTAVGGATAHNASPLY
jgi:uncharacterized Zn finger protein